MKMILLALDTPVFPTSVFKGNAVPFFNDQVQEDSSLSFTCSLPSAPDLLFQ